LRDSIGNMLALNASAGIFTFGMAIILAIEWIDYE
jgi:hypothetical protein